MKSFHEITDRFAGWMLDVSDYRGDKDEPSHVYDGLVACCPDDVRALVDENLGSAVITLRNYFDEIHILLLS